MPRVLRQSDASERIAAGQVDVAMALVKYIKFIFDSYLAAVDEDSNTIIDEKDADLNRGSTLTEAFTAAYKAAAKPAPTPPVTQSQSKTAKIKNAKPESEQNPKAMPTSQKNAAHSRSSQISQASVQTRSNTPQRNIQRSKSPSNRSNLSSTIKPQSKATDLPAAKAPVLKEPAKAASPSRRPALPRGVAPRSRPSSSSAESRIATYASGELLTERAKEAEKLRTPSPGAVTLSPQIRAEIILWLEAKGVYSASATFRRMHYAAASNKEGSRHVPQKLSPLEDPWCNGVLLCELAAVLCKTGDRSLIKEVSCYAVTCSTLALPLLVDFYINNQIPAVCACGLKKPEHFRRQQNLTEPLSQKGTAAASGKPGAVCCLMAGSPLLDLGAGLGWSRDRPRIVLAGTVVQVKSMAQVLKNIEFALNVLKNSDMTGLPKGLLFPVSLGSAKDKSFKSIFDEDVLDCLPNDVISGRISLWQILRRIYIADKSNEAMLRNRSSRSRSPLSHPHRVTGSQSPGRTAQQIRQSVIEADAAVASTKREHNSDAARFNTVEGKRSMTAGEHRVASSGSAARANSSDDRSSDLDASKSSSDRSDIMINGETSVTQSSQTIPRQSAAGGSSPSDSLRRGRSTSRESKTLWQPMWNDTVTPQRRQRRNCRVSHPKSSPGIIRASDGNNLWGTNAGKGDKPKSILRTRSTSPRRSQEGSMNPMLQKLSPKTVDPDLAPTALVLHEHSKHIQKVQAKHQLHTELSSSRRALDAEISMKDSFPPVTSQQQEAIRRWIIDLGIEFRDGDGGFLTR